MTGIPSYSTTPANNVAAKTGITWDEGMSPALVNNSARQNMTDMRLQWNDSSWFQYGAGSEITTTLPAYASGTTFTIAGIDVTAYWHVGRRVKAVGSSTGTIYGVITTTAFSTNTTVTVAWDSGSLSNETLAIYAGTVALTGYPAPGMKPATRQKLTSGSAATYTPSAGARFIRVTLKGAGGGSAGTGTASATSGGTGGTTSFNSVTAIGGSPSTVSSNGSGGQGGTGGSDNSLTVFRRPGAPGGAMHPQVWTATNFVGIGGIGGGKGGGAPLVSSTGGASVAGVANSGGGASGAGIGSSNQAIYDSYNFSGGGGEGEEAIFWLAAASYTYTVGAAGSAGSIGTNGVAGAAGGTGGIDVEEFY